jgi:hypothetical protein
MTSSIHEKDLQRNWPIEPKKCLLIQAHTKPIEDFFLRTRPKGFEGVISNSMSTRRSLAFNKEPQRI